MLYQLVNGMLSFLNMEASRLLKTGKRIRIKPPLVTLSLLIMRVVGILMDSLILMRMVRLIYSPVDQMAGMCFITRVRIG